MGILVKGYNLHINLTIPLPHRYRGGGMAVFRINNGHPEVLLGLRVNSPGRGTWSFPGGGANGKERLMSAAVREFREETGVQIYRRYITKVGIFSIKNWFFEWDTIIIETTQGIFINKFLKRDQTLDLGYGREFLSLRWVSIFEIGNYKLHRWVNDVINFYLSGKLALYTPSPTTKELVSKVHTGSKSKNGTLPKQSSLNETIKYFQSRHPVSNRISILEALYGV
jgi:8-oxo-dGTP pyrophosphatase MutT (NUDIX family)